MNKIDKTSYFEYVLQKLLNWNAQFSNSIESNDFSLLKSIKLLFFVSAAAGDKTQNLLLKDVFNNFVAMPYGHVESDVYKDIKEKNGKLTFFELDNSKTQCLKEYDATNLDPDITSTIDKSIAYLQAKNNRLVQLPAFDLVNLSHAWYSWQKYYAEANEFGQRSMSIPIEAIIAEDKIYSLNIF